MHHLIRRGLALLLALTVALGSGVAPANARMLLDPVASGRLYATSPATGRTVSTKQFKAVDANDFWVTSPLANGRSLAISFVKGSVNGSNDAGTAHDAWRIGPHKVTDGVASDPTLGGYKFVAGSNGAQDYALNHPVSGGSNTFGGSYHGGETMLAQMLSVDGVPIDPTTFSGAGQRFEINRTSTIAWSDGASVGVQYYGKLETDNVFEQSFTLSSPTTTMYNPYPPAGQSSAFLTLGFVDPRFSQVSLDGGPFVTMVSPSANLLGDAARKYTFRDPGTGDLVDIEFTLSGATVGTYVLYNGNYAKLYVPAPAGVIGNWTINRRDTFRIAPPVAPPAPFTDTFDGSALSSFWKLVYTTGSNTSTVTGGEWVLTSAANANRYTHQLPTVPGTYQVAIDYLTDGAYTGATASIQRSDSGSNSGTIGSTASLNATTQTTQTFTVTVTQGMAPVLMIDHTTATGRVLRIREMRITKTSP